MIAATPHSMYIYPTAPKRSKVINLFGGPGCGKSTLAASIFSTLKNKGYEAELVPEYAKKCVWTGTESILDDQLYVFAKQHHMIQALDGQVDYIIVDSPLLLSTVYGNTSAEFKNYVLYTFNRFDNVNFYVERNKPWHALGRTQTEVEAKMLDERIYDMLDQYRIHYDVIYSDIKMTEMLDLMGII